MDSSPERLCIVIPVYNEQDIVQSVLMNWSQVLDAIGVDYTIRAYDDGSSDMSLSEMRMISIEHPRIDVRTKPNSGHGSTILAGYREAVEDGFGWIFQVDSDNEMQAERFKELWERRRGFDFVVGRREGRKQSLVRTIVSFMSRLSVRILYGKSVWDVNSPYRLMRVSAFRDRIMELAQTTFAPNVILSGLAAYDDLRTLEIPVPQHNRTTGDVSIRSWKLAKATMTSFWQTLSHAVRIRKRAGENFVAAIVSIMLGLFCLGTNPFAKSMRCIDEMVFLYVGDAMRRGLMPYRDVFDHKGPLLYVINWLGLSISGGETWGVWLIEGALLVLGCMLLMRWGERIIGSEWGRLAVLPYLVLVFISICGGNICETYALFFIAVAFASDLSPVSTGLCLAALLMTKYTLAVPLGIVFLVLNFRFSCVLRCACWCILGILPLVGWMWAQGILRDFWEVYVGFNLAYSKYRSGHFLYVARATVPSILCLAASLYVIWRLVKEQGWRMWNRDFRHRAWIASVIYTVVGLIITFAIRAREDYYYIPLLPGCFLALSLGMERLMCLSRIASRTVCIAGFLIMAFLVFRAMVYVTPYAQAIVHGCPIDEALRNIRRTDYCEAKIFKRQIRDAESVTVLGNLCALYRVLGAHTPWRYPYQIPISHASSSVRNDIEREIIRKSSRYLIRPKWEGGINSLFAVSMKKNYVRLSETENFELWEADDECDK